jgi:transposase
MSQADAVRFLHANGLPADVIHEHLVEVFGPIAMAYSTVTRTIRQTSWTTPEANEEISRGRPPNFVLDRLIQRMLDREPEASVREIAQELQLSASTIFYVLTTRMGYRYRKCHVVPHLLTVKQKEDRVRQSVDLLGTLQTAKRLRWRFILTGDESWFFYFTPKRKLWLPPDADAPQVARQLINTPKVMVTLFWNPWGIYVSNALVGESFNAEYFVEHILNQVHLLQIVTAARTQKKRFILHMDNSPIHKARVVKAKLAQMPVYLAPHPPYSPDIAPSDFFLFGYLKEKMLGLEFDSPEALLDWIRTEFERISRQVLEEVFEDWIARVQKCIECEGDYFPED